MDGLKNYREKIKSIEELVDKMESGELSINELVELEGLTRDLHERSIILKYKAFENKSVDVVVEEQVLEPKVEEIVEEEIVEEEEVLFEAEETPVMDFSMFDTSSEEETGAKNQDEETVIDPIEPKVESVPEVEKPAPVVEKKPEHSINISSGPVVDDPKPEPTIFEQQVESESVEPEVKPEPIAEEPKAVVREKGSSFLDRLNIVDNSISSQLAGRKIDTLSGAFGINQRLLYINELFDGSGEDFSDAIKTLDTQPGLDEASSKVEELAFKNSWDPEEEVVLEFLAIIKRRYA